jgi:hypothetical protein
MKHFGRRKKDTKTNGLVDRRIFTRLPVKLPLRFLEPGNKKEHHAQVVNISANGVGKLSLEYPYYTPIQAIISSYHIFNLYQKIFLIEQKNYCKTKTFPVY